MCIYTHYNIAKDMQTCVYIEREREAYAHMYVCMYVYIYICLHVMIYLLVNLNEMDRFLVSFRPLAGGSSSMPTDLPDSLYDQKPDA